jgi:hypothetical protein
MRKRTSGRQLLRFIFRRQLGWTGHRTHSKAERRLIRVCFDRLNRRTVQFMFREHSAVGGWFDDALVVFSAADVFSGFMERNRGEDDGGDEC